MDFRTVIKLNYKRDKWQNVLIFSCLIFLFSACQRKQALQKEQMTWLESIQMMEQKLAQQQDATLDLVTAKRLIQESELFVERYPKDNLAAPYLFKAADVARGIGEAEQAISLWNKVEKNYPDYKKAADALFLQGFTYENDLKDTTKAKRIYTTFLKKYPKHPLVEQVTIILSVLGKTPEELLEIYHKG